MKYEMLKYDMNQIGEYTILYTTIIFRHVMTNNIKSTAQIK